MNLTPEQLARLLALSTRNRRGAKRMLHELGALSGGADLDQVLGSVSGHAQEAWIRTEATRLGPILDAEHADRLEKRAKEARDQLNR